MDFISIDKILTHKEIIGSGKHGKVYSVSPFYDIKIYHPWVENESDFRHEFDLINLLYNNGRNVPFPVGLVNTPVLTKSAVNLRRGFMMQHIKGIPGNEVPRNLRPKVEFYYQEEISRCMADGFFPVTII